MQCLDHVDMDCNDKRVIEKRTGSRRLQSRSLINTLNSFQLKGACSKAAFYRQNLSTEKIFNKSDELPCCIVGAKNINNLRYADDTVLLAES